MVRVLSAEWSARTAVHVVDAVMSAVTSTRGLAAGAPFAVVGAPIAGGALTESRSHAATG
jgi:hypothetical protein